MLAIGLLLIAEAAVTVLWQEPFTALWTRGEQKQLSAQLAIRCPHCGKRNVVEQARTLRGHDIKRTVRCEACHRILSWQQQSA